MNRIIYISIILTFLSVCMIKADSLRSMKNSNNFVISRNITFSSKNTPFEQVSTIRNIVTKYAGNIVDNFSIKKISLPSINIKHSNNIPGINSRKAFQIDISEKSVKIRFTSPDAAQKAVETLQGLIVVNVNGEKCFQGGKYIWSDESQDKSYTTNSHMAYEIKQLMTNINKTPIGSTLELIVVTPSDWMIETPSITEFTGNNDLYSKENGYVSIIQLKEVIEKAKERQITIKISLQLQEENKPFENCTGHSIFSVEGMRFLRSALSQWHDKCGITNVKISSKQDSDDVFVKRFNNFLTDIEPLLGITIEN